VPHAPLGADEEITDPLVPEHVDELIDDRLWRVGVVSETIGRIATHKVCEQVPSPAATA
jgi:hypothetical protein